MTDRLRFGVILATIVATAFGMGCGSRTPTPPTTITDNSAGRGTGLSDETSPVAESSVPKSDPGEPTLFTMLGSQETGIDFQIIWDKGAEFDRVFYSQNTSGGISVADFDGDQLPDLYLTRPSQGNRLYRNLGRLRFQDVTQQAGLEDDQFWGTGASFVDMDNDGDQDLFVCGYLSDNRLYENQGNGKFQQIPGACGLGFRGGSLMMAFADYDRDGDLDGYLVTTGIAPTENQKFRVRFEGKKPVVIDELKEYWQLLYMPGDMVKQVEAGQYDRLYRNDGPGSDGRPRFVEVAAQSGIESPDIGQAAVWWDYNRDGWPDLYVSNDYWGPDHLYRNNQDGTFTDISRVALPHTPWSSMGIDIADINQDGWIDLMATDMAGSNHFRQKVGMGDMSNAGWFLEYPEPRQYPRNAIFINSGTDRFMEGAFLTGLEATDWTWSPRFEDFDNDGLVDLLVTNGMTRDFTNSDLNVLATQKVQQGSPEFFAFWKKQDYRRDPNVMYRNRGDLQFEDVSQSWGYNRVGVSFGAATADLDRDGDLDIIENNMDTTAMIYRNNGTSPNRSLRLQLIGTRSNRNGLGTLVEVQVGDRKQVQYQTLARGWSATSELVVHFGVGETHTVDSTVIRWPSGVVQHLVGLSTNQVHSITEPLEQQESNHVAAERAATDQPHSPSPPSLFQPSGIVDGWQVQHRETSFDDFEKQPLLPNKLSQLGPGIACADINGDGRDDFYFGGAAGVPGSLIISNPGSEPASYRKSIPKIFETHKICEDMGSLFFDADLDGDFDLYVVSGGVEYGKGHRYLRDRLYLNHQGEFSIAKSSDMPEEVQSGSVVAAADYDRDGDLDLFVGSRVVPAEYPTTPSSLLLQNDQGRMTDVIENVSPALKSCGMVTGACWSDINRDGWSDLLVTVEWGPVRCFFNEQGRLRDVTTEVGLAPYRGWWNGISGGDIDHDGDTDFVVTNFGWNTKYHASPDHPVRIYYGDFDGSGKPQIVESEYEGSKLFPVRGKSCSTKAIPILGERFKTFTEFGSAELQDIYTSTCLEQAVQFEVNTLASGILRNDQGKFRFEPLPRIAQIAPSFGATFLDVNQDGHLDLVLGQNFLGPQRETGHMDGGVSLLLKGDGQGGWQPIWPHESGLVVGGAATSLVVSDLNQDGRADLVVSQNNGPLVGLEAAPQAEQEGTRSSVLRLRLAGPRGNLSGVGARVRVTGPSGKTEEREVCSTGGYLSQLSGELRFAAEPLLEGQEGPVDVEVRWPDGSSSYQRMEVAGGRATVVIAR